MKTDRWLKVREILDHAISLPAEKRNEYLDNTCAGDQELRTELDSLLRSH